MILVVNLSHVYCGCGGNIYLSLKKHALNMYIEYYIEKDKIYNVSCAKMLHFIINFAGIQLILLMSIKLN